MLDLEIGALELDLGRERDIVGRVGGKAEPQEAGELGHHLVRLTDFAVQNECGNRVQAVEEEVRIDLAVQRAELRDMRALARLRVELLLLAHVEAVGDGEIGPRPGEEEPGPEQDGSDRIGPGEATQVEVRIDRCLGEEYCPSESLGGDRRDDCERDQALPRGRQPSQHQVDREAEAETEQHLAEADRNELHEMGIAGEIRVSQSTARMRCARSASRL